MVGYLVHNSLTLRYLQSGDKEEWKVLYFFFDFRGGQSVKNNFEGLLSLPADQEDAEHRCLRGTL